TTEGYGKAFVEEALKHKGAAGLSMQPWPTRDGAPPRSYRDFITLYHFYYTPSHDGTPCLYKTIFSPLVKSKTGKVLAAKHGKAGYDHGQYPAIEFCRRTEDRRILGSMGICEEAYTDELDIKRQQDGLTDRTSLCHRPPMIVPYSRV